MIRPPTEPLEPVLENEVLPDKEHTFNIDGWCVKCGVSEMKGTKSGGIYEFDCDRATAAERNRVKNRKYLDLIAAYDHQKQYYDELMSEYEGPYHVVNSGTHKHLGPFTTEVDAALARSMSSENGWQTGRTYNKREFNEYLASF
jgi:hypothetical protein